MLVMPATVPKISSKFVHNFLRTDKERQKLNRPFYGSDVIICIMLSKLQIGQLFFCDFRNWQQIWFVLICFFRDCWTIQRYRYTSAGSAVAINSVSEYCQPVRCLSACLNHQRLQAIIIRHMFYYESDKGDISQTSYIAIIIATHVTSLTWRG